MDRRSGFGLLDRPEASSVASGARSTLLGPSRSLAVSLLAFFIVTLDALVVNVALPSIGHDLGGGITGLQWVVDGYTLMLAALLLSAGSLSDRIGARRSFGVGLAMFIAAPAACGLAPLLGVLVAARLVQGAAAAVLLPASLALIPEAYPERCSGLAPSPSLLSEARWHRRPGQSSAAS
jgi:MFS transporter, DHA2 family, methylenomycin A resistance protein